MRVFVTGATGFIGQAVVEELIGAGHSVVGLARSGEAARALVAAGAAAHRGDVRDGDSLRRGAGDADGVIHCAFVHDFTDFRENCEADRRAIAALGGALAGSDRPLVVTSGTGFITPGRVATEDDAAQMTSAQFPRVATEEAAQALAAQGARVIVVRLPLVHGPDDRGFLPLLIGLARDKGVSAYPGDGANRLPAVHRLDAARLFRLALEAGPGGARYHAVDDEAVTLRALAEFFGQRLGVPARGLAPGEAAAHFGWFAAFAGLDGPASSALTRERLGWRPAQPGLLADLDAAGYFAASPARP